MKPFLVLVAGFASGLSLVAPATATEPPAERQAASGTPARDAAGNTPLHRAALLGDAGGVEALLARGADPNATNQAGATPLHYGIGSERIVAALLAHGAQADAVSSVGITPLLGAAGRADSFAVARRLVAAGANINARRGVPNGPMGGANVLAVAIVGGDQRTIALLLEHQAEVNPKQGVTPLQATALVGDLGTARRLLDLGADPNPATGLSGTALNTALFSDHDDFAGLLIERGADLHLKSFRGHGTPPMVMSAYNDAGDSTVARNLIAHGIDVNTSNDAGETALSFALRRGPDTELVHYLREAGAKPLDGPERSKAFPARTVPSDSATRTALMRDSAQRAIDLLQRSSTAFLENKFVHDQARCISCHQQALPAVAFGWARERGLRVDERELGRQLVAQLAQRSLQAENARELDEPTPNAVVSLGYDADGLHALRYEPDEVTAAMSHYFLGVQRADGSWVSYVRRPPIEDGPIVGTAWAVRSVQLYPPPGREAEAADALRRAQGWLEKQPVRTHNDRVFQLLGLAWTNGSREQMQPFADALLGQQRADGGWAQLPGLSSDAWATGSALNALHKAGLATSQAPYQRGVDFLLRTQFADGSWWVRSRSWPFQPHFDGRFPHGKDQWISAAGTAWATMALLLTLEPTVAPASLPNGQQLLAAFVNSPAAKERQSTAPLAPASPLQSATVDFARDIKPLFERSCVGCHSGARPKGSFDLATRDSLLLGGQSGEPAIVPGYADDSPMIHNVTGAIEDLEMPPLARRKKYPALSPDEIDRLRAWIDAGAPWPSTNPAATPPPVPPASVEVLALVRGP